MEYREIYDEVISSGKYKSFKERLLKIAMLVKEHGYKEETTPSVDDSLWIAMELYEDMTGVYYDPTITEFEDWKEILKTH